MAAGTPDRTGTGWSTAAVLVDIGSTMIKALAVHRDGSLTNEFRRRDADRSLHGQVTDLLVELGSCEDTRICSSANGGLRVGLLALGKQVSGTAARRAIETAGANVRFLLGWHETPLVSAPAPVDMLILVGGINSHSPERVMEGLRRLDLSSFRYDRLIYAGHEAAGPLASQRWPDAVVVENYLVEYLGPPGTKLLEYLRTTYIDDIESKAELVPLRDRSAVFIEPTPSVVSRAFGRLQARLASPAIVIDVGGATTDVHFSVDLVDEEGTPGRLDTFPGVGRHVNTAYGVFDSRNSTIAELIAEPRTMDLFAALTDGDHVAAYSRLLEGNVSDSLLFLGCVFLALRDMSSGNAGAPRLRLNRLATLGLTGGASQRVSAEDVGRVLDAVIGHRHRAQIIVDRHYRWWGLGLVEDSRLLDRTFEDCGV